MKKIILGGMMIALICVAMIACKKDNAKLNQNQTINPTTTQTINPTKKGVVVGFYFTWEWHRAKYECESGTGICHFRLVKIEIEFGRCAPVQTDQYGNLYVEALVDKDLQFQDDAHNLYIDEDIYSVAPDGKTYKLPEGIYKIDQTLGKLGGYRLPLKIIG